MMRWSAPTEMQPRPLKKAMAWLTLMRETPTRAARSLCVSGSGMRVPPTGAITSTPASFPPRGLASFPTSFPNRASASEVGSDSHCLCGFYPFPIPILLRGGVVWEGSLVPLLAAPPDNGLRSAPYTRSCRPRPARRRGWRRFCRSGPLSCAELQRSLLLSR